MFKRILFFFASLLLISTAGAQCTSYEWINPKPQGNGLTDMFFLNKDTGYVVGNVGTILRTYTGGDGWDILEKPTDKNITSVWFLTAQHGFISALANNSSEIYETTDGGDTWQMVFSGYAKSLYGFIRQLHFPTQDTGYAYFNSSSMLKTTDGGKTWTTKSTPSSRDRGFTFTTGSKGVITGYNGIIYYTENGGATWGNSTISAFGSNVPNTFQFINDSVGYITSSNAKCAKTTDGGKTWTTFSPTGAPTSYIRDLYFKTADTAFLLYDILYPSLAKSTDSANTFSKITFKDNNIFGKCVDMQFMGDIGFFATDLGYIYKTADAGNTWQRVTQSNISSAYRMNKDNAGNYFYLTAYNVHKTANRFRSSSSIYQTPSYEQLSDISIVDSLNFWVCGKSGFLRNTADGGKTWAKTNSINISGDIKCVHFFDKDTGILVFDNGVFYRSTNGGKNFTTVKVTGLTGVMIDVEFNGYDTGIAIGQSGLILRTIDGGKSWAKITSGTTNDLRDVYFYSPTEIWICGNSQTLLKSTDAGATWTNSYQGFYDNDAIAFANDSVGYLLSSFGAFLRTEDKGYSWTTHYLYNGYTGEILADKDSVLIVGSANGIAFKVNFSTPDALNATASRCGLTNPMLNLYVPSHPVGYTVYWYTSDSVNAIPIAQGSNILINRSVNDTLYVQARNQSCITPRTAVPVNVYNKLNFNLVINPQSDSICAATLINLTTNADTLNKRYTAWYINDVQVANTDTFAYTTKAGDKVYAKISLLDGCPADSIYLSAVKNIATVTQVITPRIKYTPQTQCYNNNKFTLIDSSETSNYPVASIKWVVGSIIAYGDTFVYSLPNYAQAYVSQTVTDIYGCKSTKSIPLQVTINPEANFKVQGFITKKCLAGNTFVIDQNNKYYSTADSVVWITPQGNAKGNRLTFSSNHTGIVPIQIVASDINGCTDTATIELEIFPQPKAQIIINAKRPCTQDNYIEFGNVSPTKNLKSQWWKLSTGAQNTDSSFYQVLLPKGQHTVRLVVIDSNNCQDTAIKPFEVFESPKANMLLQTIDSCENNNLYTFVNTSQSNNGTHMLQNWRLGAEGTKTDSSFQFSFSAAGQKTITLTITDSLGCKDSTTKKISVLPAPAQPTILGTGKPRKGDTVTYEALPANYPKYSWWLNTTLLTDTANKVIIDWKDTGSYQLKLTYKDVAGCESKPFSLSITVTQLNTGINNAVAGDISFYPNPATAALNIINSSGQPITITINTLLGQKISTQTSEATTTTLNVESLPAGNYLLQISNNSQQQNTYKLSIVK